MDTSPRAAPGGGQQFDPPDCAAPPVDDVGKGTDPAAPPPPAGRKERGLDWRVRFALLALVWGLSFLFVKVSGEAYEPLQVALGRVAFGAVALLLVVAVRREVLPRSARLWLHLAVAAFLLNALPFTLFAYSEQRITSALAGICNATTPLFTLLVAVTVLPGERPDRNRLMGMGLGFLGVLVVFGIWGGISAGDPVGAGQALAAALSMGTGWVYVRRFLSHSGSSSVSLSAAQLTAGTVELALAAPFITSVPHRFPFAETASLVVLGAVGTGLAFLIQYSLVRDAGATVASMVTYLVPIISTTAGVLVLGEGLKWHQPVGAVVILLGAALSQRTRRASS
ncbi:DMT family transporter [Streptomyces sp. NPDC057694]|uniref:DMT family transporter n=1 Tax=Streptomyces sp. NPDC057694 TaxID=3346216 RepID=UPI0036C53D9D